MPVTKLCLALLLSLAIHIPIAKANVSRVGPDDRARERLNGGLAGHQSARLRGAIASTAANHGQVPAQQLSQRLARSITDSQDMVSDERAEV